MKRRRYKAIYKGKEYTVFAVCEEGAYWEVLMRKGIRPSGEIEKIVAENLMEIFIA